MVAPRAWKVSWANPRTDQVEGVVVYSVRDLNNIREQNEQRPLFTVEKVSAQWKRERRKP